MPEKLNMRRPPGFTLIEGLVACFILTAVFFAAAGLYPSSVLATLQASHHTSATDVAVGILENARMRDFAQIPVGDTVAPDEVVNGKTFHPALHVELTAPDVKRMQVTVTWMDRTPESVTYQSAIFDLEGGTP